ncbi:ATP-citrate synthase alpha chain protein 2 [Nymphaea thermarum]|nr:ATP-citrate synthase alpha chain protein 2 [Nymphaea thermarum]
MVNAFDALWRGIRTPGIPINASVFKTDSFNSSDIHPFALRPIYRKRALAGSDWLIYCAAANPDGQKGALVIGGGIANFTVTFNGIIKDLREKACSDYLQKKRNKI